MRQLSMSVVGSESGPRLAHQPEVAWLFNHRSTLSTAGAINVSPETALGLFRCGQANAIPHATIRSSTITAIQWEITYLVPHVRPLSVTAAEQQEATHRCE